MAIAASGRDLMADFIEEDDLLILGNRPHAQQDALDLNVSCIVVCQGAEISMTLLRRQKRKEIVIISTPHDTFTVARLINQSIPVNCFMTKEGLVTFGMKDYG